MHYPKLARNVSPYVNGDGDEIDFDADADLNQEWRDTKEW